MRFHDISHDSKTVYTLGENEKVIFFMLNRVGTLDFNLKARGAQVLILSLFLDEVGEHALSVTQRHSAPETTSSFIGKALVGGSARFKYDGLIVIEENAALSDASQDCRNLILSENAGALARPALEIKTDDVRCHHAATTSTLSKEALFFAESRGIERKDARGLLASGFARTIIENIPLDFQKEKKVLFAELEKRLERIIA